jgi:hypothetical protein
VRKARKQKQKEIIERAKAKTEGFFWKIIWLFRK